jgi:amino acid adenylation domain-containing protein
MAEPSSAQPRSSDESRAEPAIADDTAELSFGQQRLWLLDQLLADKSAYNETGVHRMRGALDVAALERAFGELVRRHEVLRTRYVQVGGVPLQAIDAPMPFALAAEDLGGLAHETREAHARQLALATGNRPFDLAREAPLRVRLLRLAPDEHWLIITVHHIATDRWSSGVLAHEVSSLYDAYARGEPSPLPELPIQYADFAVWQRQRLSGALLARHLDFWREELADLPLLALPTDRPRPPEADYVGAQVTFAIDAETTQALKALARREGATLFMTALAAFQVLLYRYTGQEDIAVGVATAGRSRTELEGLIGFFVSTIVLRGDARGEPTFTEYLARVKRRAIAAYAHQELPFEKLVSELAPARDLSRNPLFQVVFSLHAAPNADWSIPGIAVDRVDVATETSKFDLFYSLREADGGLQGRIQYAAALFDEATIVRMAGHFRMLLEAIAADPRRPIGALPLLGADERNDLVVRFNDTAVDCAHDGCVAQRFEAQVRRTPDAIAVVAGGERLTYAQLNARANRLAHHLRALGVAPETRVGVCIERSLDLVVAIYGVLKSGGAFVPLDPGYPAERIAFMLADADAPVLLTQAALRDTLPAYSGHKVCIDADWPVIAARPDHDPPPTAGPDNLAYVLYTSGSTGRPKGVMIEQRSLTNYTLWSVETFYRDACGGSPVLHSIAFDGVVTTLFAPLVCGQAIELLRVYREAETLGAGPPGSGPYALVAATPAHLKLVNEQLAATGAAAPAMALLIGGEAMVPADVAFWQRRYPQVRIVNQYGPTEATVACSTHEVTEPVDGLTSIPVGRPLRNARLYVLDARRALAPIGVIGELYVAGVGVGRGYVGRPDLTAERFSDDPLHPDGGRMYRTGDLARRRADGVVELFGRSDQQVKIRGYRIELQEIEVTLLRHPGVRHAVVTPYKSDGVVTLAAYVVLQGTPVPNARELRVFLQQSLPDYMVPGAYVSLDALPITANGKVDRAALPAPAMHDFGIAAGFVAPRNALETRIAPVWSAVLGIDRVDVQRDFFDMGGHSLSAMQLLARLEAELGVEIEVREFFARPTIEALAALCAQKLGARGEAAPAATGAAPPIRPSARVPVTRSDGGTAG